MSLLQPKVPIQSTAGAIPVINEKGEYYMQKVKVQRYVTGKRPDFAPEHSSDEDEDDFIQAPADTKPPIEPMISTALDEVSEEDDEADSTQRPAITEEMLVAAQKDSRLRRLIETKLAESAIDEDSINDVRDKRRISRHHAELIDEGKRTHMDLSGSEEEDFDDDEIEIRRAQLRQKVLMQQPNEEEEIEEMKEEAHQDEEEEFSENEEEYSESDDEMGPRLKPVFVRKKDRVTIHEKEMQELEDQERETNYSKVLEDRRLQSKKMVETIKKDELEEAVASVEMDLAAVNTDDENDEAEYEAWKLRELRRIKRDRDEKDTIEQEKAELERIRNMTEEERRAEFKNRPKLVTNKQQKGKYKFMQKYFHRGAFFLDREDDVLRRDFAAPTLEDHFDKTILPKVMQVKNFGKAGRTKYTHLVDQDTTAFDSPWVTDTAQSLKFFASKSGGTKPVFERPSAKKR